MFNNSKGFSLYTIIIILAIIALAIILIVPQFYNVKAQEKTDKCIENMKKIKDAIESYMYERKQSFNEDLVELVRTGYLRHAYECPENGNGDKYIASGDFETGEIIVTCPNVDEFPDHVLK